MKYVIYIVCVLTLVGCSFGEIDKNISKDVDVPKVCFGTSCYHVEIADESHERQQGLMWRESMPKQEGMLFIFPDEAPRRTFWMKNTLIPLDMIWLDKEYTIVHIETDVPPCTTTVCPSYGPLETQSQYVIELNAGELMGFSSALGDKVSIFYSTNEEISNK